MRKTVKKTLLISAAMVCMAVVLTACGGKADVIMNMGEPVAISDTLTLTPENLLVSFKVYPPISGSGQAMGWVCENEENTYVTLVARVENDTDQPLEVDDLSDFRMVTDKESFDSSFTAAVTEDGTALERSTVIEAGASATVYFITEAAKSALSEETMLEFSLDPEEEEPSYNYKLTADTTQPVAVCEELNLGETIGAEGLGDLTPKKVRFTKRIDPDNPGYYYDYYQAQGEDERLLVMNIQVKNTSGKKQAADGFYGLFCMDGEGETYIGSIVADDSSRANIRAGESIGKNKTRTTYGVFNLPKSAGKTDLTIYLYADGTYYRYVRQGK
jgi:hypothetical protein